MSPCFSDSFKLDRLIRESDEFGKLVEGLTSHADGAPSPLDKQWRVWNQSFLCTYMYMYM